MIVAKLNYEQLKQRVQRGMVPIPNLVFEAFPQAFDRLMLHSGHESVVSGSTIHLTFKHERQKLRWRRLGLIGIWISLRERYFDEIRFQEVPEFVQVHYEFETGLWDDMRTERILVKIADDLSPDPDFRAQNRFSRLQVCRMQLLVPYVPINYHDIRMSGAAIVQWSKESVASTSPTFRMW